MQNIYFIGVLIGAYLIGSFPIGYLIVKAFTGKDIREVQSGRTGGTNAMRAAGFWAGLATTLTDILKGASVVWIARAIVPGNVWLEVFSAVLAVIGHNYSVFLIKRDEQGKLRFHGGAGGAPSAGGAVGLWAPSFFFTIPFGAFVLFFVGYASLATMSMPLIMIVLFSVRAWMGVSPWQYVIYGVLVEIVLIWALRPNIKRLFNGTERLVGLRARRKDNLQNT